MKAWVVPIVRINIEMLEWNHDYFYITNYIYYVSSFTKLQRIYFKRLPSKSSLRKSGFLVLILQVGPE